jgi:hypothetical protein
MNPDRVFEPLRLGNLTVRNRIFRSSIAGRFEFYRGVKFSGADNDPPHRGRHLQAEL